MSKSLIKLVDNSLMPAAVMIIGKFAGVVLAIEIFDIPWSIKEYANSIFTFNAVLNAEDVATVTSYSDLAMFILLALFFTFTVIRAIYFHSSHIKPTLVVKLANRNLLSLIQSSYEIYHTAAIGIIFTWLANILIIFNIISQKTYPWVGVLSFTISVLLTVALLRDVYKEIENIKHNPGEYNWKSL